MRAVLVLGAVISFTFIPIFVNYAVAQSDKIPIFAPAPETTLSPDIRAALRGSNSDDPFSSSPNISSTDDSNSQNYVVRRCGANWCVDTGDFSNDNPASQFDVGNIPGRSSTVFRFRRDFQRQ
ncbi:MAG: hypothetical protein JKY32_10580 [Rhizobiales bacterium]|nr:hypothetical protein [Hyphomicrobiales bacterium]